MVDSVIDSLLKDALDLHVHSSPDILERKLSDLGVARAYKTAGLRGVLIKCHVTPTASRAALVREAMEGFHVYGGLVLNKMAGGLNPVAVETEIKLGAKVIWMPTISSENHIKRSNGDMRQAVLIADDKGALRAELNEIFDLIAGADAILGTGHLTSAECEKVVAAARTRGVKKIVITHPEYMMPSMPVDVQRSLARTGILFERCFYASYPGPHLPAVPPELIAEQIKAVGADVSIMATDFGQAYNEEPLEGFRRFIGNMLECGISFREIALMVKTNPAALLGI
jgi:hypothetical protein